MPEVPIKPGDIISNDIKLDTIERVAGPYPAPKFTFVYKSDFYPFKNDKLFYRIIDKEKNEVFVDSNGIPLIPKKENALTFYGRYKKARGALSREIYLKPYKVVLTKRMRERDTINRYFVKYKLAKYERIFEISKSDYNSQTNLYDKVYFAWQLKGSKENILMKNKKSLEHAEGSLHGIQNFLDPLQFYEEDITLVEKLQKNLSRLKFTPESTTDTSPDLPPPPDGGGGQGPPPPQY